MHKCNDQNIKETMLQIFHNDPLVTREINSFSEPEVVFWEILFLFVLCIDEIFFWHVPFFHNFLICLSYESTYFAESILDSPVKAYISCCAHKGGAHYINCLSQKLIILRGMITMIRMMMVVVIIPGWNIEKTFGHRTSWLFDCPSLLFAVFV